MADNLYFSRDTKLYAAFKNTSGVVTNVYEIPILDGFSFSQSNNTSEITLSEMESSTGVSRRGRKMFNDSLAPAEWSFSTYMRPFIATSADTLTAGNHHAVEEVLWAQMAGADKVTSENFVSEKFSDGAVTTSDSTDLNISFAQSNRAVLQGIDLYFVMETSTTDPMVYRLVDAIVNEATMNFDVDGIATIEWSGFATDIKDWKANTTVGTTALGSGAAANDIRLDSSNSLLLAVYNGTSEITAIDDAVAKTDNFIRNRLSQIAITATDATTFPGAGAGAYNITLTGGSITISNNIEYLTPEEIGKVNLPIAGITGTRSITGSFNCYLVHSDTSNAGTSSDFFADFKSTAALGIVTNDFGLTFKVGGTTGTRVEASIPTAHIEIPVTSVEDVISFEVNFHGLGTNISSADEIALTYFGS